MKATSPSVVVGPWAREKLDALQRYLDFYTKVLKNQRWETIYVDAYAGGGRSIVRAAVTSDSVPLLDQGQVDEDEAELISGSPRVALDIANPFDRYVFIEPNPNRADELAALRSEYGNSLQIELRREDAATGIHWLVGSGVSRHTHRGVVFLDPFGAGLEWSTIEALANTGFLEVVINFALNMAIQRMLPNSAEFQPGWRERLDAYFGTTKWHEEVYEKRLNLFGNADVKREDYLTRLLSFYRGRLKQTFGHVAQPKLIRNTRGVPLYYLLWAGPNATGLKGANYILGMGERLPRGTRERR